MGENLSEFGDNGRKFVKVGKNKRKWGKVYLKLGKNERKWRKFIKVGRKWEKFERQWEKIY